MKYAAAFAVFALATSAFAASGNDFLMDAAKGDNAEVMLGKLAMQKAQSTDIKKFGQMLMTDHTAAKKEVAALATSMSANMPSDVKPEAQHAYDKMALLNGAEFDREFIRYMVEDHQKDIAAFTKESQANDGKISALAAKQLPTLKRHLATAQSLQGSQSGAMQGIQPPQRLP